MLIFKILHDFSLRREGRRIEVEKRSDLMKTGIRIRDDLPEEVRIFRRDVYDYLQKLYLAVDNSGSKKFNARFVADHMVVATGNERPKRFYTVNEVKDFKDFF